MPYNRYDARRDRSRHDDDRGFFERAGDEIASWFGDDEPRRRNPERQRFGRDDWGRDDDRAHYRYGGWGERSDQREFHEQPRGRYGREPMMRDRERGERFGWREYERNLGPRDYRSGPERGFGPSFGENRGRSFAGGYGRSESAWGRDDYRGTSYAGSTRGNDRHYDAWRQREMSALDRDYDQYCRERQERFENDFGNWREQRMNKRRHLGGIRNHMDVVGSDGKTIGKVDCVKGDHIVLTKSDSPDNRHHAIDCSMIESVDGDKIRLDRPAEEAKSRWDEADRRGLIGRDREEHTDLNRAFSGTYED